MCFIPANTTILPVICSVSTASKLALTLVALPFTENQNLMLGTLGPRYWQSYNHAYCWNYLSSLIAIYIMGKGVKMSLSDLESR